MAMRGITGFRLRREKAPSVHRRPALPAAHLDKGAQDRVMAKTEAMGEDFYTMSEVQFGDWLDALPRDEFIEFIAVMIELDDRSRRAAA